MELGVIKWFNNSKGFGVADTVNGPVFVHIKSFKIKPTSLSPRDAVLFKKRDDPKSHNAVAINTRVVGDIHDWMLIMLLVLNNEHKVDQPNKGTHLPIAELAAYQYLNGKSRDQIFQETTSYFQTTLSDDHFLSYGEFIEKVFTRSMGLEKRNELLTRIFTFFGEHVNERKLFLIWKSRRFQYIGHLEADDFEIPLPVLRQFAHELSESELSRIRSYSYGSQVLEELTEQANVK